MEPLIAILSAHTRIGLDTSPFIYLWEQHPRYFNLCRSLFTHLGDPQVKGFTSLITLIETCAHPQRAGRLDLVHTYERALLHSQQVHLLPIDIQLARRAVALRAQYAVRVPDALQLAAAIEQQATLFVTNDRRLKQVREITVLVLDEFAD